MQQQVPQGAIPSAPYPGKGATYPEIPPPYSQQQPLLNTYGAGPVVYQPSTQQPINMQGVQPGVAYQVVQPRAMPTSPSYGCVLAETICGMMCCCFVLGLVGLVFALVSQSNNNPNPEMFRKAHYLGIASIASGICLWICTGLIFIIYIVFIVYAVYLLYFFSVIIIELYIPPNPRPPKFRQKSS